MTVDEGLLRLMAEELARMAERCDRLAADYPRGYEAGFYTGKAEGYRFGADAISELVEPALRPPLEVVE